MDEFPFDLMNNNELTVCLDSMCWLEMKKNMYGNEQARVNRQVKCIKVELKGCFPRIRKGRVIEM
jgi:hypothetical protein